MASFMEVQVDGTSATLVGFLTAERHPLDISSADVLSDYEDRDFDALAQSNLPVALKNTLHKTALSFKTPPMNAASTNSVYPPDQSGQQPNKNTNVDLNAMQQQPMPHPMIQNVQPQSHMIPGAVNMPLPNLAMEAPTNQVNSTMAMKPPIMGQQLPQVMTQPPLMMNMQGTMPPQRPSVTVPVVARDVTMMAPVSPMPPCQWFSPTAIHDLEVSELRCNFPDLFVTTNVDFTPQATSSSGAAMTNALYLQLRNTLIDVYRANPSTKLTLAECRKHCDGDLATLIRLLSFLERHRLVNYALTNTGAQSGNSLTNNSILDPATKKLKEELSNHWTSTPTCSSCDRICLYSFYVLSPSIYGSCLPYSTLRTAVWCHDCVKDIPQNQCLLKVNLPALHIPGGTASWSEQQICALFDAIETLGPDWVAVSKAVSSVQGNPIRTPRECLAAFLSMPLSEHAPNVEKEETTAAASGKSQQTSTDQIAPSTETEKFALNLLLTAMELLQQRANDLPPIASAISTVASTRLAEIASPENNQPEAHNPNAMDSLLANSR